MEDGQGAGSHDSAAMRGLFDLSIDLLAVVDLETRILEASSSFERTLGWSPSELIGRSILDLYHPDQMPQIMEELASLLEGGDAVGVVVQMRTSAGDYRWVQGNARSDLAAGRIYVTGADITDRMALEATLRRHLHLEELVASIATRLIGAEHEHVIDEIQRGIEELAVALGADRGHFLRGRDRTEAPTYLEWRNPETVTHEHVPAADEGVQRWWRHQLRDGRLLHLNDVEDLRDEAPHVLEALRDDGVRSILHVPLPPHRGFWGFLTIVAVRDRVQFDDDASALLRLAGESFMTAVAATDDAVALTRAQQELEARNAELLRKNEELEGFAYAAAHDLKAPLSRVEMALSATSSIEGSAGELLGVARRAATRMRQLIEDLLTFAAAGTAAGAASMVDLDDVLTQVLSDLEPVIAAQNVTVQRGPLPPVMGHRPLLGQLMQNVVGNAVKFTRSDVDPVVRVDASHEDDGVVISVTDNGIGIPVEHRDEVFAVFTRLHSEDAYAGSGIGLATCAKVVDHHGGRIWIEDGLDGGTAVRIWLPDDQRGTTS
ncbi:MAG: sensor histidine kinase [Microthrixaceae bacterium]